MISSHDNHWQQYLRAARGADFTAVVARHGGWMLGVATRATGNPQAAEDIAQEALVLLLRKRPRCPTEAELGAWLHRTVVLLARNYMKKEQRRAAASLTEPNHEPDPGLPEEVLRALDTALDSLPQGDRELILARHYRNLSWEQLAAEFGKTADTLRKQGGRVLAKLAGKLRKKGVVSVAVLEGAMGSGVAAGLDAATAARWSAMALRQVPAAAAGTASLAALKPAAWAAGIAALVVGVTPLAFRHTRAVKRDNAAAALATLEAEVLQSSAPALPVAARTDGISEAEFGACYLSDGPPPWLLIHHYDWPWLALKPNLLSLPLFQPGEGYEEMLTKGLLATAARGPWRWERESMEDVVSRKDLKFIGQMAIHTLYLLEWFEQRAAAGRPDWEMLAKTELLARRISEHPSISAAWTAVLLRHATDAVFLRQLAAGNVPPELLANVASRGLSGESPTATLRRGILSEMELLAEMGSHPGTAQDAWKKTNEEFFSGPVPVTHIEYWHRQLGYPWHDADLAILGQRTLLAHDLKSLEPGGYVLSDEERNAIPFVGDILIFRWAYLPWFGEAQRHTIRPRPIQLLQQRSDSLRLVAAAELYRRSSGAWPADASQLGISLQDPETAAPYEVSPAGNGIIIRGGGEYKYAWPQDAVW